ELRFTICDLRLTRPTAGAVVERRLFEHDRMVRIFHVAWAIARNQESQIVNHKSTSTVSRLMSLRRMGPERPPILSRGAVKSAGWRLGKTNVLVTDAWELPLELSRDSITSRRISLKRRS